MRLFGREKGGPSPEEMGIGQESKEQSQEEPKNIKKLDEGLEHLKEITSSVGSTNKEDKKECWDVRSEIESAIGDIDNPENLKEVISKLLGSFKKGRWGEEVRNKIILDVLGGRDLKEKIKEYRYGLKGGQSVKAEMETKIMSRLTGLMGNPNSKAEFYKAWDLIDDYAKEMTYLDNSDSMKDAVSTLKGVIFRLEVVQENPPPYMEKFTHMDVIKELEKKLPTD